jgi:hypothetical protein
MFPPFFMLQISDGKRSFAKTGFGTSIQQEALKDFIIIIIIITIITIITIIIIIIIIIIIGVSADS